MTQKLSGKIVEIAQARRRLVYRCIHDMLRRHFLGVNHKKVYRLYSAANLDVRTDYGPEFSSRAFMSWSSTLAMQFKPAQPPSRSINLATLDFLVMNGTAKGGRSQERLTQKLHPIKSNTLTLPDSARLG